MAQRVTFNGRNFEAEMLPHSAPHLNLVRLGVLPHLGSLRGNFCGMSQPQVYEIGGAYIAASVSHKSQFVDILFALKPV